MIYVFPNGRAIDANEVVDVWNDGCRVSWRFRHAISDEPRHTTLNNSTTAAQAVMDLINAMKMRGFPR